MNLLKETTAELKEHGKTPADVRWVGSSDFMTTWDDFVAVADVTYDSGYGAPEVAQDLLIVGDGFWMERHEYDGSEWWEYKEGPAMPTESRKLLAVTVRQASQLGFNVSCGWETLASLNGIKQNNQYTAVIEDV